MFYHNMNTINYKTLLHLDIIYQNTKNFVTTNKFLFSKYKLMGNIIIILNNRLMESLLLIFLSHHQIHFILYPPWGEGLFSTSHHINNWDRDDIQVKQNRIYYNRICMGIKGPYSCYDTNNDVLIRPKWFSSGIRIILYFTDWGR